MEMGHLEGEGGSFDVDADACSLEVVKFTAPDTWYCYVKADGENSDWLHVSPARGGKGDYTLPVEIDRNEAEEARCATLIVQCGSEKIEFVFHQQGRDSEQNEENTDDGKDPPAGEDDGNGNQNPDVPSSEVKRKVAKIEMKTYDAQMSLLGTDMLAFEYDGNHRLSGVRHSSVIEAVEYVETIEVAYSGNDVIYTILPQSGNSEKISVRKEEGRCVVVGTYSMAYSGDNLVAAGEWTLSWKNGKLLSLENENTNISMEYGEFSQDANFDLNGLCLLPHITNGIGRAFLLERGCFGEVVGALVQKITVDGSSFLLNCETDSSGSIYRIFEYVWGGANSQSYMHRMYELSYED